MRGRLEVDPDLAARRQGDERGGPAVGETEPRRAGVG